MKGPMVWSLFGLEWLAGSLGSFVFAAAVVLVALRFFPRRVFGARAHLVVACVPFVKLGWGLARGIPRDAFVLLQAAGVARERGSFQAGFGMTRLGPTARVMISGHVFGEAHPRTAAGLLASGLDKHVSPYATTMLLLLLVLVRMARRAWSANAASALRTSLVPSASHVEDRSTSMVSVLGVSSA